MADFAGFFSNRSIDLNLRYKLAVIWLREGLTHSNKSTGLFTDQYLRDGFVTDADQSLLLLAIKICMRKIDADNKQIIIPVINIQHAYISCHSMLGLHPEICQFADGNLMFDSFKVDYIKIFSSEVLVNDCVMLKIVKHLGTCGALASMDQLLNIVAITFVNGVTQHPVNSGLYFSKNLVASGLSLGRSMSAATFIKNQHNHESWTSYIQVQFGKLLSKMLIPVKHRDPAILQTSVYKFYQELNVKLLLACQFKDIRYMQTLSDPIQALLAAALARIEYKCDFSVLHSKTYAEFILAQEFILDEITGMLAISCPYTEQDFISTASLALAQSFDLNANDMLAKVALTGSCMHAMNLHIQAALNYFMFRKSEVNIYIAANAYHEIPESLGLVADHTNDRIVTISNFDKFAQQYSKPQIVEMLIIATNNNVNYMQSGFGSNDVHLIIDEQLQLRVRAGDCSQLIVILDVTMNCLDDVQLQLLFNVYLDQIHNGRIAFLVATSLNKYLQIGCDRAAAGLCAAFYAQKQFIGLDPANGLLGYQATDTTPQYVTHLFRHATQHIGQFYDITHGLSRHIHENLFPDSLYNINAAVYIDRPYTSDIYKNIWSFIVIRFANTEISTKYEAELTGFLEKIDIGFRDGFAFNQSTYIVLERAVPTIVRISIGPNATTQQFKLLADKLCAINLEVSKTLKPKCLCRG